MTTKRWTQADFRPRALVVAAVAATLCACRDSQDWVTPAVSIPAATYVKHPDGSYEIKTVDMKFLLPADGSVTGPFLDSEIMSMGITFEWPNFPQRPKGGGDIDVVGLRIFIYTGYFARQTPRRTRDAASGVFSMFIENLDGPFTDERTGLLEYRTKRDVRPVIFAFQDASVLRPDGSRPFLYCIGGIRDPDVRCSSSAMLSPYVEYEYTFSTKWAGDWPAIDSAINGYIEQLTLEP